MSPDGTRFLMDFRPINGSRRTPFKTKTAMWEEAKRLFAIWQGAGEVEEQSEDPTFSQAYKRYVEKMKRRLENPEDKFGAQSLRTNRDQLKRLLKLTVGDQKLGGRKVRSLSRQMVVEDLWPQIRNRKHNGRPTSPITALSYMTAFKSFLKYCVARSYVDRNVAELACDKNAGDEYIVLPNRVQKWKEKRAAGAAKVHPDNVRAILAHTPDEHKSKIRFAIYAGLRISEQLTLKVIDRKADWYEPQMGGIDFKENVVLVRNSLSRGLKTSEDTIGDTKSLQGWREVPLDPAFCQELRLEWEALPEIRRAEGWLFPSVHGTRSNPDNWRKRILYAACDNAGITKKQRPCWHELRHAFATAFLTKMGPDFVACQELMGHADMSTTLLYKHVIRDPERDKKMTSGIVGFFDEDTPDIDPDNPNIVPFKKAV